MITVERPGLLTTIQDGGRWGYQALGVPVAGPMDPWSAEVANLLAGNGPDAALLEITLTGPTLLFHERATVGIAGADFDVQIEGRPLSVPGLAEALPGERLVFGRRRAGCRAYLAVAGGIASEAVLGSRATHARSRMGAPLRVGDTLAVEGRGGSTPGDVASAPRFVPAGVPVLRIVAGPQDDAWSRAVRHELCVHSYRVSPESDRMGYRLDGPAPWPAAPSDLPSMPTVTGAIQLPPDGRPILLMADRQTTGGYAIVAVVCLADIGAAAQLAPGDDVRFETVSLETARRATAEAAARLRAWAERRTT